MRNFKKYAILAVCLLFAALFAVSCHEDDNNGSDGNAVVGTWKLVAVYQNDQQMVVSDCALQENFIFGADQFSHETYSNGSNRALFGRSSDDSDDDSDDDDDHHSSDDSDDDSDDDTDDNGSGGTGACLADQTTIGSWTASGSAYAMIASGATQTLQLHFTDNNTKFWYEKTLTVNGVQVVRRYVFQRQ